MTFRCPALYAADSGLRVFNDCQGKAVNMLQYNVSGTKIGIEKAISDWLERLDFEPLSWSVRTWDQGKRVSWRSKSGLEEGEVVPSLFHELEDLLPVTQEPHEVRFELIVFSGPDLHPLESGNGGQKSKTFAAVSVPVSPHGTPQTGVVSRGGGRGPSLPSPDSQGLVPFSDVVHTFFEFADRSVEREAGPLELARLSFEANVRFFCETLLPAGIRLTEAVGRDQPSVSGPDPWIGAAQIQADTEIRKAQIEAEERKSRNDSIARYGFGALQGWLEQNPNAIQGIPDALSKLIERASPEQVQGIVEGLGTLASVLKGTSSQEEEAELGEEGAI